MPIYPVDIIYVVDIILCQRDSYVQQCSHSPACFLSRGFHKIGHLKWKSASMRHIMCGAIEESSRSLYVVSMYVLFMQIFLGWKENFFAFKMYGGQRLVMYTLILICWDVLNWLNLHPLAASKIFSCICCGENLIFWFETSIMEVDSVSQSIVNSAIW